MLSTEYGLAGLTEEMLAIDAYTRVVSLKLRVQKELDEDPDIGPYDAQIMNTYIEKLEALEARLEALLGLREEDR